MDRSLRNTALKTISVTGIFCFLYSVILLLRMLIFEQNGGYWESLYNCLLTAGGLICGFALVRKGKGKVPGLLAVLTFLAPMLLSIVFYGRNGIWRVIFEVVIGILLYFVGFRASYIPPVSVLGGKIVATGAITLFVCLAAASYYSPILPLRPGILFFAYVYLGAVLLLSNQTGIDEAFIQRHIDRANIPGNMRKFNTSLVLWLYGIIVLLINIKAIVTGIATFLRTAIVYTVYAALVFLNFLSRFFKLSSSGEKAQQGNNMLEGLPEGGEGGILSTILNILLGLLMLYLLYVGGKRLPAAFRILKKKLRAILERLTGYLQKLLKVHGSEAEEVDDYQDEVQMLKGESEIQEKQPRIQMRRRKLKGITDPVQKVRYMYGILLEELRVRNIDVKKSDTTGEIVTKVDPFKDMAQPFSSITRTYEVSRYGEAIPEVSEMVKMEEEFIRVEEVLKRRRK